MDLPRSSLSTVVFPEYIDDLSTRSQISRRPQSRRIRSAFMILPSANGIRGTVAGQKWLITRRHIKAVLMFQVYFRWHGIQINCVCVFGSIDNKALLKSSRTGNHREFQPTSRFECDTLSCGTWACKWPHLRKYIYLQAYNKWFVFTLRQMLK